MHENSQSSQRIQCCVRINKSFKRMMEYLTTKSTYGDNANWDGLLTLDAGQQRRRNGSLTERTRSEVFLSIGESFRWPPYNTFNFFPVFIVQEVSVFRFHQRNGVLIGGVFQTGSIAFNHHRR